MGCASSKVLTVQDLERKICDKETKREMFFSYQVIIVRRPDSINPDKGIFIIMFVPNRFCYIRFKKWNYYVL